MKTPVIYMLPNGKMYMSENNIVCLNCGYENAVNITPVFFPDEIGSMPHVVARAMIPIEFALGEDGDALCGSCGASFDI
jgi:hypothetical protein